MILKQILVIASLLILSLSACTDDLKIPDYEQEIVVDGRIESGNYAKVFVTLSNPYFSDIDSSSLADLILTVAKVTVSTDEDTEILSLTRDNNQFPPFYYRTNRIVGKPGKSYDLKVEYAGYTVTATTTIPEIPKVNSVRYQLNDNSDSLGVIKLELDDPPTTNYYKSFTRRFQVDKRYIPTYISDFDDTHYNGEKLNMSLLLGNPNPLDKEDLLYFKKGTDIYLKFCSVDQISYEFWKSVKDELFKAGNPFASTNIRIKSNIEGGLGIWCGYGVSFHKISTTKNR